MKNVLTLSLIILLPLQLPVVNVNVYSDQIHSIQQGNTELLAALNMAIFEIVNDGTYQSIYQKWFEGTYFLDNKSSSNIGDYYPTTLTPGGTLENILETGTINWGADITYPPFEYEDRDGVPIGFDIDFGQVIAAKLGNHYKKSIISNFVSSDWEPIIANLQIGDFDAILSAMTITEERETKVDFSRPYFTTKFGLISGPYSPTVSTIEDLDNDTLRLGVQTGTGADAYAMDNLKMSIFSFSSFYQMIDAVVAQDVDFGLDYNPVAANYLKENADLNLTIALLLGENENYGIAVREDQALTSTTTTTSSTNSSTSRTSTQINNNTTSSLIDSQNTPTIAFPLQLWPTIVGVVMLIVIKGFKKRK